MSVILDALHKARKESQGQLTRPPHDTRALDLPPSAASAPPRKRRSGLLLLLVLGSVLMTLTLCAGAFFLLALRMGVIQPDWSQKLLAGELPLQPRTAHGPNPVGGPVEVSGWAGPAAAASPAAPSQAAPAAAAAAPQAAMTPFPFASGNAPIPTPAPISAVAAAATGQVELPISVQQQSPHSPPAPAPAAELQVSRPAPPAAPVAASPVAHLTPAPPPAITVGTILCDSTGCTAALNGRTVRPGDVVLDYTVMAVTQDQVTLGRPGEAPVILRPRF